jgi:hypothetical protein
VQKKKKKTCKPYNVQKQIKHEVLCKNRLRFRVLE